MVSLRKKYSGRKKYCALKFGLKKRSLRNTIEYFFSKVILLYILTIRIKKFFEKKYITKTYKQYKSKKSDFLSFSAGARGSGGEQHFEIFKTDLDRYLWDLPMVKFLDRVLGKLF
jgi:hypothetical protein